MTQRKTFNVYINQCAECSNLSQINVRNYENIKEMEEVEEEVKAKFFTGTEFFEEFNRIENARGFKGNEYHGTITIFTKKFKCFAEVESHKCCECGGNY
jgi:hypothetical protein